MDEEQDEKEMARKAFLKKMYDVCSIERGLGGLSAPEIMGVLQEVSQTIEKAEAVLATPPPMPEPHAYEVAVCMKTVIVKVYTVSAISADEAERTALVMAGKTPWDGGDSEIETQVVRLIP